jgi:2-polyprenyl-3-methyl-5-hydroxy-6-metoxy-1,4-benzoquinol methylase
MEISLTARLAKKEEDRTVYWEKYDPFVNYRVRWRASVMRHLFHVLPGQKILEIGAGDGLFTQALVEITNNECEITAGIFSTKYKNEISNKLRGFNAEIVVLNHFPDSLQGKQFDYVVFWHLLEGESRNQIFHNIRSFIKPGGGLLVFEPNPWNPYFQVHRIGRRILSIFCKDKLNTRSLNRIEVFSILSEIGYTQINALPYDFLYAPIPKFLLWPAKHISIIMENFPYIRNFAGSVCIWARNPVLTDQEEPAVDLCKHEMFYKKVSFVIPCHNEEMNIPPLIKGLRGFLDKYIFEIIIVDDNSSDKTAEVTKDLSKQDNRIRLIRRTPPNGVGRALRDGICAAGGKYVLIMDSDFQHIIPEMRDLFDVVVTGADVAIGSRFSRESVLINYGFTKIIANRAFHFLANLLLGIRFRDLSNNLKLFRCEVAKRLEIESYDFAANVETGLKPVLLGYRVVEVPISWVNRSVDMGFSTFQIFKTGPNYWKMLVRLVWRKATKRPCQKEIG